MVNHRPARVSATRAGFSGNRTTRLASVMFPSRSARMVQQAAARRHPHAESLACPGIGAGLDDHVVPRQVRIQKQVLDHPRGMDELHRPRPVRMQRHSVRATARIVQELCQSVLTGCACLVTLTSPCRTPQLPGQSLKEITRWGPLAELKLSTYHSTLGVCHTSNTCVGSRPGRAVRRGGAVGVIAIARLACVPCRP
jgi:hypothetical protein